MGCKGTGGSGQYATPNNILSLCRLSQALRRASGQGYRQAGRQGGSRADALFRHRRSGVSPVGGGGTRGFQPDVQI